MTLTGVYVPLITPFDASGGVAFAALEALAHEVLDAGASGVVALGTTAEPTSLNPGERNGVVDVIARVCRERSAKFLVGANSVEAVPSGPHRSGVTAALSVVPPFLRPGEAGLTDRIQEPRHRMPLEDRGAAVHRAHDARDASVRQPAPP